tara:strand:- start:678 stop:1181 length:504 start_codon:yes stop_codon:yes gene_type:complete
MPELLLIEPQTIMTDTILSGNVDIDKLLPIIKETQLKTVEELLGSELYDKIKELKEAGTLADDYLTLVNDYIKPILINQTVANYILISPYTVGNGGFFKRTYNGVETTDYKEVERVSQIYSSTAQMYINRFNKWIIANPLAEYKTFQEEVNAITNINLNNGWYFGNK